LVGFPFEILALCIRRAREYVCALGRINMRAGGGGKEPLRAAGTERVFRKCNAGSGGGMKNRCARASK